MIFNKIIIVNVPSDINTSLKQLKDICINNTFESFKSIDCVCFRVECNDICGYDSIEYYENHYSKYIHIEFKTLLRKNKLKKLL